MGTFDHMQHAALAAETSQKNGDYWDKHRADEAAGDYVDAMGKAQHEANTGVPTPPPPPDHKILGSEMLGSAAHHIEDFASTLWDKFGLDHNHKPNGAAAVPSSAPVPSSPGPTAGADVPPPSAPAPSPAAASATAGASSPAPTPPPGVIPAAPGTAAPPPSPDAASEAAKQKVQQQAAPGAAAATAAAIPSGDQQKGAALATKAAAASGTPPGQPEPPHSTTHLDYDELDQKMYKAAAASARAGHDPGQVIDSLRKTQMGFIQSGMLRNLTVANQAILSGDQEKLQQALKNVNYWLPDGKDLQIHTGTNGQMQYIDPIDPKKDGKDNWVDVTPEHIQMLALNIQDPTKAGELIQTVRGNQAKIAHEAAQDNALMVTAEGQRYSGYSKYIDAQTQALIAPATIYEKNSSGTAKRAYATYLLNKIGYDNARAAALTGKNGVVPFAQALKMANDASVEVANMAQGQLQAVPVVDERGRPSLSPAAGKSTRDPTPIPVWLREGMTAKGAPLGPTDIAGIQGLAGRIAAANAGTGINKTEAAEVAGRIYQLQRMQTPTTHLETSKDANGKEVKTTKPDFLVDKADPSHLWLFRNGGWENYRIDPHVGASLAGGEDQSVQPPDGDVPESPHPQEAPDNAPAG